jgi:hypothetical protein
MTRPYQGRIAAGRMVVMRERAWAAASVWAPVATGPHQ